MEKIGLSKSQYCRGKRCIKSIWLYKNSKDLAKEPSAFQAQLFKQAHQVGALAQEYFGEGELIDEDHKNLTKAIEHTQRAINNRSKFIFEATFKFDDILIRVDVLKVNDLKDVDLIEVKSVNSLKKEHCDDIAIQKYVLENLDFKVNHSYLMHLNKEYVRKGDLDLKELFTCTPMDDKIEENYAIIWNTLDSIKTHLRQTNEPKTSIGSKCKRPYLCEFKDYCWQAVSRRSIHTLSRISDKKRHELMDMGVDQLVEIPNSFKLTKAQEIQIKATKDKSPVIASSKIRGYLNKLRWPPLFF